MNQTRTTESGTSVEKQSASRDVLVVGGGISGIEAALNLAYLGCETTLVDQGESLAENAAELLALQGSAEDPFRFTESRITAARRNPRIHVQLGARVVGVKGNVGNFRVRIDSAGEVGERDFGAIVVATGLEFGAALARTDFPQKVMTHLELEKGLTDLRARGMPRAKTPLRIPKNVCFIVEDSSESSAIHSTSVLKHALAIRKLSRSNVFVCCQNVNVSGEGLERLYREARSHGVVIFKFDDEKPRISTTDTGLAVTVRDNSASAPGEWNGLMQIGCDLLVLPERIMPRSNTVSLKNLLGVTVDSSNYFQENNIWLKPAASNRKGIFFVGACRGNFDFDDILTEARSTALHVYNLVRAGELSVKVGRVAVDASKCALCLTCLRLCPHGAVEVAFDDATGSKAAKIIDIACEACGICAAECPAKAIQIVDEHNRANRLVVTG